jgi:transposase
MNTHNASFIGIDVSKLWFDASLLGVVNHVRQGLITERFDNNTGGLKSFEKWLKRHGIKFGPPTLVVIENTGIYHRLLWSFCSKKNLPLHIGNAAHMRWSFGIARGKNDMIDSVRLCEYAYKEADRLKATPVLNPVLLQLKDLMTARTKLLSQHNAIKIHLKELKQTNQNGIYDVLEKAYRTSLNGIATSIKKIEQELADRIASNEQIKSNFDLLTTVPGIGPLTAIYIICCTNNFAWKISGKQLACYAGVAPFEHSSGSIIRGKNRVHKMANKTLKKMLHLGALSAIRYIPEFRQYYQRKKNQGKHSMCILNAIRNKIALRAVAVVNNRKPYVNNIKMAA